MRTPLLLLLMSTLKLTWWMLTGWSSDRKRVSARRRPSSAGSEREPRAGRGAASLHFTSNDLACNGSYTI